jgi:hypothetical protein
MDGAIARGFASGRLGEGAFFRGAKDDNVAIRSAKGQMAAGGLTSALDNVE